MAKVYLGIGTNIGNKRRNMITAAALLAERVGDVLALSDFYETEPWGFDSEHTFLNAVLLLDTAFTPDELLNATQQIESDMGRTKKSHGEYHDRVIDIDLLMVDDLVLQTPTLIVPHPLMHKREFVMAPFAEIAPHVLHPILKKTIGDLYKELPDS